MAGILNIGISALKSYQQALATTGNNVANASTPGYSRQQVQLGTQIPQYVGSGYVGSGVKVENVRRHYDEFLAGQVRAGLSAVGDLEAWHKYAAQIDGVIANEDTGLDPAIQRFFDAFQGLSNDPADIPSRSLLLAEANSLAAGFQALDRQFREGLDRIDQDLGRIADDINHLSSAIADLNERIAKAPGRAQGKLPNDLLDQRDQLIDELSGYLSVTRTDQDDGMVNLYFAQDQGLALVLGNRAGKLAAVDSSEYPDRKEIAFVQGGGKVALDDHIRGGELGGLLKVRREVYDRGLQQVGLVAAGLAIAVNGQHVQGLDLDGIPGGAFFTDMTQAVAAHPDRDNTGGATLDSRIVDIGELRASDYRLSYDGADYRLERLSDHAVLYQGAAFPSGAPYDGFQLDPLAGAMAAGDRFLIRPTADRAGEIAVQIDDARKIAAAGNTPPTGVSDNRNALALAGLQQTKLLFGDAAGNPTASLQDAFGDYVAATGSRTRQAQVDLKAQRGLLEVNQNAKQEVSGVNLDEEAADLVRFQQAYQAAAQVVRAGNTVFDALISAVGR